MNTIIILLFLNLSVHSYMIDGGKQRWHECEFPHSWDRDTEHVIDTLEFEIHYG